MMRPERSKQKKELKEKRRNKLKTNISRKQIKWERDKGYNCGKTQEKRRN